MGFLKSYHHTQVREISMEMMTGAGRYDDGLPALRWQTSALLALQEASEAYLVHLFEDAYVLIQSP